MAGTSVTLIPEAVMGLLSPVRSTDLGGVEMFSSGMGHNSTGSTPVVMMAEVAAGGLPNTPADRFQVANTLPSAIFFHNFSALLINLLTSLAGQPMSTSPPSYTEWFE